MFKYVIKYVIKTLILLLWVKICHTWVSVSEFGSYLFSRVLQFSSIETFHGYKIRGKCSKIAKVAKFNTFKVASLISAIVNEALGGFTCSNHHDYFFIDYKAIKQLFPFTRNLLKMCIRNILLIPRITNSGKPALKTSLSKCITF